MRVIRIATRASKLAMWQSEHVAAELLKHFSQYKIEFIPIVSQGDKILDQALTAIGGKALFVKALEQALLNNEADIAVHSVKDMGAELIPEMAMPAILLRADVRDVYCQPQHIPLAALPAGAVIGTASPRRACQLKSFFPKLTTKLIRGNVQTRLEKMLSPEYDAIILASAGLQRLGLAENITEYLPVDKFIPAIGQGAIGVECLAVRDDLIAMLQVLNHAATENCVKIERKCGALLGGGCHVPMGVYARVAKDTLVVAAMLGDVSGATINVMEKFSLTTDYIKIADKVAQNLLSQGGGKFLI
jgi:hydroxymethylbilane synthase